MSTLAASSIDERMRLADILDECRVDPKALINQIKFYDPSSGATFKFEMFPPEDWEPPIEEGEDGDWVFWKKGAKDWYWQSLFIDWLHDPKQKKYLILKARQLGITLLACAYALWLMLFEPGAACVAYSYTEDEAKKLVEASWAMFQSLPDALKSHVTVVTPHRSETPSEWIRLRHQDGKTSSFQALPATKKHGHGARVRFAIMDEVAYMDHARRIYTAINPATTRGRAKLLMLSTAFGVSNPETGEGNFFHTLFAMRKVWRLAYKFLPWNLEPTRGDEWYASEAMKLPEVERNQQYPLNENDAFMLSGSLYFDRDALAFYRQNTIEPLFYGRFELSGRRRAQLLKSRAGDLIEVYERPKPDGRYAMGVDAATGRGTDFTCAHVIDLDTANIVARFHGKIDQPRAAFQLHFLGKWYNEAEIAVERQGGYGDAIIIALRDGNDNLPAYRRLYRHKKFTHQHKPKAEEYGIPMSSNRPALLAELSRQLYDRLFAWLPSATVHELGTFVHAETNPSPRAQDGCNDDAVMSLAITLELYRQKGQTAAPRKRWRKRAYQPSPVRQTA